MNEWYYGSIIKIHPNCVSNVIGDQRSVISIKMRDESTMASVVSISHFERKYLNLKRKYNELLKENIQLKEDLNQVTNHGDTNNNNENTNENNNANSNQNNNDRENENEKKETVQEKQKQKQKEKDTVDTDNF